MYRQVLIERGLTDGLGPVCLVRRSPLTELRGIPGVTLLRPSETERFIELRRASPELGAAIYRGLVVEVARHQTGLVLCPTSPSDGELLRTRVEVPRHRLPGRGVAIINGTTTPVQVALPSSQRVSSSR